MKNIRIEPPYDINKIKEVEIQSKCLQVYYEDKFMGLFTDFIFGKEFVQHSDNEDQIYDSALARWYMETKVDEGTQLHYSSGWSTPSQCWFSFKEKKVEILSKPTEITRDNCEKCNNFHHKTEINTDGTPVRCRRTGKTRLWKTRPEDFKIPVKYGLRQNFYLTPFNAKDWTIVN